MSELPTHLKRVWCWLTYHKLTQPECPYDYCHRCRRLVTWDRKGGWRVV